MFRSLIDDAKTAAGAVVSKYVIRASVAVPFLVAAGFATAALTLTLIERFGAVAAYGLMAGIFAAVGLISALLVTIREHEEEAADAKAASSDAAGIASEAATQAALQLPLALAGSLLTTPLGPGAAVSGVKLLARNLPLVLLLLLIGFLLWPEPHRKPQAEDDTADKVPEPAADQPGGKNTPDSWPGAATNNGLDRAA